MAADTFEIASGDVQLRVEGLRSTLRALADAGADAADLKDLMQSLGQIVATHAQLRAPRETGRLATTVRPGRGKTKAVVRAGGARAPYAGVIHYGWPARNIPAQPFLADALQAQRARVLAELDDGIEDLLRKHDLL